MPGDFGEFTVNIGLGINFLAGGTLYLNSNDTLSYRNWVQILQICLPSNGDLPPFIKDYMPTHTWVRYAARLRWHMRAALNSEYAHHNQTQYLSNIFTQNVNIFAII